MPSRKLNELDANIDDAKTSVEEFKNNPETPTGEKLEELHQSLEAASDTVDDLQSGPESAVMPNMMSTPDHVTTSRELNELDASLDDAKTTVEGLQDDSDSPADQQLDELLGSPEAASDRADDLQNKDEAQD